MSQPAPHHLRTARSLHCTQSRTPARTFPRVAATVPALLLAALLAGCGEESAPPAPSGTTTSKPALTVQAVRPQSRDWPQTLSATGDIAAWQEAIIGAEIGGYRITEVRAQIGDRVKKGEVLARMASDTVDNELAESRAAVADAEAALSEAKANVERSRQLREKGFYSAQQNTREQTLAESAQARLDAARARLKTAALRQGKASVLAPDDGVVSARIATVGSLTEAGKELFRLIRQGRLEWRAEVTADELHRLRPGQPVRLVAPDTTALEGRVRAIAPTVNPQTRLGLVYVDLPADAHRHLGAGMFARGDFSLGQQSALSLPQSAVLLREGFAYVFRLENATGASTRVALTKVETGRRQGDEIEVRGLPAEADVVASGAGFLADGDTVRLAPAEAKAQ